MAQTWRIRENEMEQRHFKQQEKPSMAVQWKQYGDGWDAVVGRIVSIEVFPVSDGAFIALIRGYVPWRQRLAATDIDAAKAEALGIARRMLVEAVEALGEEK